MNKYSNNLDYRILELLAQKRYIPIDYELIAYFLNEDRWKVFDTIRKLKSEEYVREMSTARENRRIRKDTLTLSEKGVAFCKAIGIEKSERWARMGQSLQIWRNRFIGESVFCRAPDKYTYVNALVIDEDETSYLSFFNNVAAVGYIDNGNFCYAVYYLENESISVDRNREKFAIEWIKPYSKSILNNRNKLDRIIIVDSVDAVKDLISGKNLYVNDEAFCRGEAYFLPKHKHELAQMLLEADVHKNRQDETIIKVVRNTASKLNEIIINRKYFGSTIETDKSIMFDLILPDLHILSDIKRAVEDKNERRKILVWAHKDLKEILHTLFGKKILCHFVS